MRDLVPFVFLGTAALAFVAAVTQRVLMERRKDRLTEMPRLLRPDMRRHEPAAGVQRRRFEGIPVRPMLVRR